MTHHEFTPTDEQRETVKDLLIFGASSAQCCACVTDAKGRPITEATFERVFFEEIATACQRANAAVVENLVRIATSDGPSAAVFDAAKFYLQARCGWPGVDGDDGKRISRDEKAAVEAFVERVMRKYRRPGED